MPKYVEPESSQELRDSISRIIRERGLSEAEASRRLGFPSPSQLNRRLNEGKPAFSRDEIERICQVFQLGQDTRVELLRLRGDVVVIQPDQRVEVVAVDRLRSELREIVEPLAQAQEPLPAQLAFGTAPPMPTLIIGRDSDLTRLKQRVGIAQSSQQSGSVKVLTAMRGWPGVGKTTLAAALAHDEEIATHFGDGVLWASLGQQPNLFEELAAWGRAMGIPDLHKAPTVEEASERLAGMMRTKRALLIVDDVWEASHLLPFRIGGTGCALLVTTRLPEIARAIASTPDDVYVLGVLDTVDALDLLRILAPTVVAANEAACRQLVEDLEGLPLTLQVAGRLLQTEASYGFGVTDLLRDLHEGAALIAAQAPADRADIANQTTPTVAALLELSTNRLDEAVLRHFAYLGAFPPKPASFDMPAIQSVWEVDDPKPILRVLLDRGLLEPTDSRYWMHAILVTHARSFWMAGAEQ